MYFMSEDKNESSGYSVPRAVLGGNNICMYINFSSVMIGILDWKNSSN